MITGWLEREGRREKIIIEQKGGSRMYYMTVERDLHVTEFPARTKRAIREQLQSWREDKGWKVEVEI